MSAIKKTVAIRDDKEAMGKEKSVVALHGHAPPEAQQADSMRIDQATKFNDEPKIEEDDSSFRDVVAFLDEAQQDDEVSDAESTTGNPKLDQIENSSSSQNRRCASVPELPHAQQAANRGKGPCFGPIKKRKAVVRRDWPFARPEVDVAHDVDAQEEAQQEPEASFDSEDVSEPSGSENDYNNPEMVYEFKRRTRMEDIDDSDEETKITPSITGTSDDRWLTNSSREGADESITLEGLSQEAKWKALEEAEARMERKQEEKEEIARVAMIHLAQRMGLNEEEDEEEDELNEVVILSPPDRCEDPGAFTIPAVIDGTLFLKCLVDSGAARNLISETAYKTLTVTPLKPYRGHLRFGNQRPVRALGILEVNIIIEGYPVSVDLVVIKAEEGRDARWKVILGRPFMATVKAEQSFLSNELTLHLPNVLLKFSPEGDLKKREPHNEAIRWGMEIPRVRTHVPPSLGGWRGRGRGR